MPDRGKKYQEAAKLVDRSQVYPPLDAVRLLKETTVVSFDATTEAHVRLGVDPRHADQMVRGTVVLPHGTGKRVRVLVFAQGDKAQEALRAGADEVGGDDLVKRIESGWLEFDVAIATPDMMGMVGRIGPQLGPRGLMPNPKAGTVTTDVGRTVTEVKGGRVEYRTDKTGNVHLILGKASFDQDALARNFAAALEELIRAKPATAKGKYVQGITVSSTMGPGLKVDPNVTPRDLTGAHPGE